MNDSVDLLQMPLARVDRWTLLEKIFSALDSAQGGWLITANLDFLRRWHKEPHIRSLYSQADLLIADGMPLVWASLVMGDPLPERVAGSTLVWHIAERAAREGRCIYMLGGEPKAAEEAERQLVLQYPELNIVGRSSPWVSNEPTTTEIADLLDELRTAGPDIVWVGLGSPKQERVIAALRSELPKTWFMGVGISFSFVAGHVRRAPKWVQSAGLEWVHRLAQEPRRLARRYLIDDLPFAATLFSHAVARRLRNGKTTQSR